ncbi:type IV secretion system protein [Nocardiopsis chromatogenes]|uniref:type IV secretion system protein n=1 Tax=Nocardiopsis chromatogenes TaxID=280239 RepID=UPI0005954119|nr:type IV secretion system protein [Nocardiopsis chromatogenes]
MALLVMAFLLVPVGAVQADPMCPGEPAPLPESAGSGADGLLVPPQAESSIQQSPDGLPPDASLYGQYGTAGQQWHVIRETCVDKLGSSAAATLSNTMWDLSRTINQSTITVYQAAMADGLLNDFNDMVSSVVAELRDGVWRPLLPTVIILGAVALAWYGLIRKRVTLTFESAIWMVVAIAVGLWILAAPSTIMGTAARVVNSGGELVNAALNRVTVEDVANTCPVDAPSIEQAEWESANEFAVRKNSQTLWSGLVCRPWMAGQFGSTDAAGYAELEYGVPLLEAQGINKIEQKQIEDGEVEASTLMADKQEQYEEIASGVEDNYPEIYPTFEGAQQGERFGIAMMALFAAVFAGGLIMVASLAVIVLKIGFMLLVLLSPIFFLVGVHPGYGRSVLLRWFEMVLGMLLKQIFMAVMLAVLMMCYSIVMAGAMSWGLKVILLALFTVAVIVFRKPFANIFSSVNANTFTSRLVDDALQSRVMSRSANVLPPVAYMRAQKWGLKRAPQLAAAAAAVPSTGVGAGGDQPDIGGRGTVQGAPEQAEGEGGAARGEGRRVRGSAGYGRAHGKSGPPPLKLGATEGKDTSASAPSAPPPKSADQAPSLGGVAAHSGGVGPGSGSRGSSSGPIPPRPAGGYRGTGDTGWASVFGTGSGSGQRSGVGGDSRAAEPPPRGEPSPTSGSGIFKGREATPPQGNVNRGSRWGGPRSRRERPAPPRQSAPPASNGSKEGGHWFKSGDRDPDRPISPFWTGTGSGTGAQRRPDKDVPFWLKDGD